MIRPDGGTGMKTLMSGFAIAALMITAPAMAGTPSECADFEKCLAELDLVQGGSR
jgi:hypothetical protein